MQSLPDATLTIDIFFILNYMTTVCYGKGDTELHPVVIRSTSYPVIGSPFNGSSTCQQRLLPSCDLNVLSPERQPPLRPVNNRSYCEVANPSPASNSTRIKLTCHLRKESARRLRRNNTFLMSPQSTSSSNTALTVFDVRASGIKSYLQLVKTNHTRLISSLKMTPHDVTASQMVQFNYSEFMSKMHNDTSKNQMPVSVVYIEELFSEFFTNLPQPRTLAQEVYKHAYIMMDKNVWYFSQFELERKLSDLIYYELITQFDRAQFNSNDVFLVGYDEEETTILGQTMANLGLWPAHSQLYGEAISFVVKANGTLEIYFSPENLSYFLFNCLIGFLGIRYN